MSLTTKVNTDKIAIALGRDTPESGSVTEAQWQMWIKDALMLIQIRSDGLSIIPDQVKLDYVIREAVVDHIKRPDSATQVTIAVDDGSTSKTYQSGEGRVTICDEWWKLLGLGAISGRAFSTDTMPTGAGAGGYGIDYWWVSPIEQVPLP